MEISFLRNQHSGGGTLVSETPTPPYPQTRNNGKLQRVSTKETDASVNGSMQGSRFVSSRTAPQPPILIPMKP